MHSSTWRAPDGSRWWIGRRWRSTVLRTAEGALDAGEALIGADHARPAQGFVLDAGADDIEAVEPGLLGSADGLRAKVKPYSPTVMSNSLASLSAVLDTADGARDPVGAPGRRCGDLVGQLGDAPPGGLQQILALAAGPLLGQ